MKLMKGSIEVKSKLGEGTTFLLFLSFPVYEHPQLEPPPLHFHSSSRSNDDESLPKNPHKALIVEDNKLNQMILEKALLSIGIPCDIANNGIEGSDLYLKHHESYTIVFMVDILIIHF